jgi:hypothetical protein
MFQILQHARRQRKGMMAPKLHFLHGGKRGVK